MDPHITHHYTHHTHHAHHTPPYANMLGMGSAELHGLAKKQQRQTVTSFSLSSEFAAPLLDETRPGEEDADMVEEQGGGKGGEQLIEAGSWVGGMVFG